VLPIIEVADTTLNCDQNVKPPLYAQHGIPEVWVVDVASNRLEIYREPLDVDYRMHLKPGRDEKITLLALAEVSMDLGALV
jgi:Uma2 family endonuclease